MKLAIAVLLASSVASAEPSGWDGGIVHFAGTFPIAHESNFVLGTRLEAGGHYGPLVLLGEYTYYRLQSTMSDDAHRLGATARVRFGGPDAEHHERYAWLELGAGEQFYGMTGHLTRRDVAAGAGWQMEWRNISDVKVGFFFALRATQATAPVDPTVYVPAGASPACRGSCPMSPSAGVDRSILFTAGVVFGS